jgi:hypothetical protein
MHRMSVRWRADDRRRARIVPPDNGLHSTFLVWIGVTTCTVAPSAVGRTVPSVVFVIGRLTRRACDKSPWSACSDRCDDWLVSSKPAPTTSLPARPGRVQRCPFGSDSIQGCARYRPVSAHSAAPGAEECRYLRCTPITMYHSRRTCVLEQPSTTSG